MIQFEITQVKIYSTYLLTELLKRRVSSVQEKILRLLGSTTALDQPAVYGGFESVNKAHK